MTINFKCPKCRKQFKLADNLAGRKGQCPDCGGQFKIPGGKAASTQQMRAASSDPFSNLDYDETDPDYKPRRRRRGGFFSQMLGCLFLLLFLLAGLAGAAYSALYFKVIKPEVAEPYLAKVPFKIPGLTTGPKPTDGGTETAPKETSTETASKEEAKKEEGPNVPPEYRFLPDKTALLASINVEAVLASKLFEKLGASLGGGKLDLDEPTKAATGVPLSGVRRVVIGARTQEDAIQVLLTKEPITADEVKKNRKGEGEFTEVKVGKYVMYDAKKAPFCVVSDRMMLIGGTSEALKKVLERDKPPEMVADLQTVFKQVTDTKAVSLAFGPQEARTEAEKFLPNVAQFKAPPEFQPLLDSQAFVLQLDLTSGVEISATLQCKNAADAEALKKALDDLLAKANAGKVDQPVKDVLQAVKLAVSGDAVSATLAAPEDTVVNLVQGLVQMFKAMFAPPPKQ